MCKRLKLIPKEKLRKSYICHSKFMLHHLNIFYFMEARIFNRRIRKRKEKTAHTILFRMYMPLCIPLFRLCELFKSSKGITKNIRC